MVFDRLEGGRELLEQNEIPVVSLLSLASVRDYCDRIAAGTARSYGAKRKARAFLKATHRLRLIKHFCDTAPSADPRISIVPNLAPPLTSLGANLRYNSSERKEQLKHIARILDQSGNSGSSMVIFPELTVPLESRELIEKATRRYPMVVVAGAEYDSLGRNLALVAIDGQTVEQAKLVRSPYDRPDMVVGDTIHIFKDTYVGDFAVLVCADLLGYQLIDGLRGQIDILVIVAKNRAMKLFASTAAGDSYRLYSFIVIANDLNFGNSLVASPQKGEDKIKWLKADPSTDVVYFDLPLERLKRRSEPFLRDVLSEHGMLGEPPQ